MRLYSNSLLKEIISNNKISQKHFEKTGEIYTFYVILLTYLLT